MKTRYILSSLLLTILIISSCTKSSDAPIGRNDPTGNYSYISNSNYFVEGSQEPIENSSDGLMNVNWYTGSSSITINVQPYIGFSYNLIGTITETHGDTTIFKINAQTIYVDDKQYKLTGSNSVDVPRIGMRDGYYVQDSKIEYTFKSIDLDSYQNTDTHTEGTKQNY